MAENQTPGIHVEVAYAKPSEQKIIALTVPVGTTAFEAVVRSNITDVFPEIELETVKMGVFGKGEPKPRERVLQEGDRVELYRPLIADPKEVRKRRAAAAKAKQDSSP